MLIQRRPLGFSPIAQHHLYQICSVTLSSTALVNQKVQSIFFILCTVRYTNNPSNKPFVRQNQKPFPMSWKLSFIDCAGLQSSEEATSIKLFPLNITKICNSHPPKDSNFQGCSFKCFSYKTSIALISSYPLSRCNLRGHFKLMQNSEVFV